MDAWEVAVAVTAVGLVFFGGVVSLGKSNAARGVGAIASLLGASGVLIGFIQLLLQLGLFTWLIVVIATLAVVAGFVLLWAVRDWAPAR